MEGKLSQSLALKQQMQLVMTPELQQAIRLLQLSGLELVDEIQNELDGNPILLDAAGESKSQQGTQAEATEAGILDAPPSLSERMDAHDLEKRDEDKRVQDIDWEQFLENRTLQQPGTGQRGAFDELPPIEQNLTKRKGLVEHLREQLQASNFRENERAFAELVLSSLDESGFIDLKSSYRDAVADLVRAFEKSPHEKYPVLNLGVMHESLGEHGEAIRYFQRFLGVDLTDDEVTAFREARRVITALLAEKEQVVRALYELDKSYPGAKELARELRKPPTSLERYEEGVRLLSRHGPAELSWLAPVASLLREARALDLSAAPGEKQKVARAAEGALSGGGLEDADDCLTRLLADDVEPQERLRVEGYLRTLAEIDPSEADSGRPVRDGELTIEHLADRAGLDPEDAEEVLHEMQRWDPIGCCSRDLRECLLVQAEELGFPDYEIAIIDQHMHNLEKHNYAAIAKDLKIPVEDVHDAVKEIQKLESRPARNFTEADDKTIAITPDVYVIRDGDKYTVSDNDRWVEELKINYMLYQQLRKNPQTKEFIDRKLRSAKDLIDAIRQRRQTIIRVTERIVERQRDFFDKGVDYLKPMILRDIAEEVGMHESTISRVTTNKYVHTPRGIFELKYFFNSSIRRTSGGEEDVASESVKQAIKKIIEGEDKQNPLSDQQIVELLAGQHEIKIARRTVAKYREMLGILASSRRKKVF